MDSSIVGYSRRPRFIRFMSALALLICLMVTALSSGWAQSAAPLPDSPSGFFPGNISIIAGGGTGNYSQMGVPANSVDSHGWSAFTVDSKGNIYIGDGVPGNYDIYVIYGGKTPVPPVLTAVASGNPQSGYIYLLSSEATCSVGSCGDGATLDHASFDYIQGVSIDSSDNLYVTDELESVIRKVDYATGVVTTVAGQPFNPTAYGSSLGDPQLATSATLQYPSDARVDNSGNLYIADASNDVVRVVYGGNKVPALLTPLLAGTSAQPGFIYTIAGVPQGYCAAPGACGDDGAAASATFGYLISIDVDGSGNLYIADGGYPYGPPNVGPTIRLVYAGTAAGPAPPLLSTLSLPQGQSPQAGYIYAIVGTELASCSTAPCGDGGLALQAQLNIPYSTYLQIDPGGDVYFPDSGDNTVRKVDAAGYISSIAGVEAPNAPGGISTGNGGPATSAVLFTPTPIAFDAQNNLYLLSVNTPPDNGPLEALLWQVTPAKPQMITFSAFEPATYGDTPIKLTGVSNSGLPVHYAITGDFGVVELSGSDTSGYNLIVTGSGTVQITASQAGNTSYGPAAPVTQTLTVSKASLSAMVNPSDESKLYGAPNPLFTAVYAGFINGDTEKTALNGEPVFSTTAQTNSDAGTYPVTITQGSLTSNKYAFTFVPGTLTITGATKQSINFLAPPNLTYGQASTVMLTATATSQLPVQYTIVSGPAKNLSGGATLTITGGGSVVITANQIGNDTYAAAAAVTQTFTVNPAPLTVTGPTVSLPYGTAVNTAQFPPPVIAGFVGTDTQALVTGNAAYSTVAGTPQPGNYAISVAVGTLVLTPAVAPNYTLAAFVPGTLNVATATQSIAFEKLAGTQFTYQDLVALTATATSGLPVTFTLTGPGYFNFPGNTTIVTNPANGNASALLTTIGVGTITITASQAGNVNYSAAAAVSQTLTVNKAPLVIQAINFTREYGAANPTLTYGFLLAGNPGSFLGTDSDVPGVISGVPVLTTTATAASQPGSYPIVITQGTLAAPNYYFELQNATLSVLPAGNYTVTSDPGSLTIPKGQNRQTTLTLTPLNFYQGTVTLSCEALPTNVACIFSPSSYAFTGNLDLNGNELPLMGTLTVNTLGGQPVVGALRSDTPPTLSTAAFLLPGALAGLLVMIYRKRIAKGRNIWQACALFALMSGLIGIMSCGGSSSATSSLIAAPGTTTVTVNAIGTTANGVGNVAESMKLTITIQ